MKALVRINDGASLDAIERASKMPGKFSFFIIQSVEEIEEKLLQLGVMLLQPIDEIAKKIRRIMSSHDSPKYGVAVIYKRPTP